MPAATEAVATGGPLSGGMEQVPSKERQRLVRLLSNWGPEVFTRVVLGLTSQW